MAMTIKSLLAAGGCAALLAGCATGPYYGNQGSEYGYGGYGYGDAYGHPGYIGPSIGVGIGSTYYHDRDDRRQWREERRESREERRGWRDGRREAPTLSVPGNYRGPADHMGEPIGPGYRPPPGSESPG